VTSGPDDLVDEELRLLLDRWVPAQRWFANKGTSGELILGGALDLGDTGAVQVYVVSAVTTRGDVTTYQVPLTFYPDRREGLDAALVGELAGPDGPTYVYDGAHDPAFVREWLELIDRQESATEAGGPSAQGRRQPGGVPVPVHGAARVLSGEQSNTSVIVEGTPPVIVKLFRTLYGGANPDVVVQSALAAAGSTRVPTPSGWVEGSWTRPDGSAVSGHLAFASEFLVGTRDAWREARESVSAGEDFGPQAHTLGQATAEVHQTLAEHLATEVASPARRSELVHALRVRAAWACNQVDGLRGLDSQIKAIHDQLDELTDFPVLQRIHGDYHLGQVLDTPGRGWVLLDFEGEPLRPISERSDPDLALRDVAGMLRSFDYAAAQTGDGEAWAARCRAEFCLGYADVSGRDPREHTALLGALELDKALYEVVYEARNRPDWIEVPLRAVARLTAGSS
jgi:predicted trehalose synthase